jgi:hypothetical protein
VDQFEITIKFVDKLPMGDCGYCAKRSRTSNKYEIAISRTAHKTVSEMGATLLHELLHLWVFILQVYGYRVRLKTEHQWIKAIETTIIEFMYILKQDKRRKV